MLAIWSLRKKLGVALNFVKFNIPMGQKGWDCGRLATIIDTISAYRPVCYVRPPSRSSLSSLGSNILSHENSLDIPIFPSCIRDMIKVLQSLNHLVSPASIPLFVC
jgi:hypothetical protein